MFFLRTYLHLWKEAVYKTQGHQPSHVTLSYWFISKHYVLCVPDLDAMLVPEDRAVKQLLERKSCMGCFLGPLKTDLCILLNKYLCFVCQLVLLMFLLSNASIHVYLSSCLGWNTVGALSAKLLHALGFSVQLYAFFRDGRGRPRTPQDWTGKPPLHGTNISSM